MVQGFEGRPSKIYLEEGACPKGCDCGGEFVRNELGTNEGSGKSQRIIIRSCHWCDTQYEVRVSRKAPEKIKKETKPSGQLPKENKREAYANSLKSRLDDYLKYREEYWMYYKYTIAKYGRGYKFSNPKLTRFRAEVERRITNCPEFLLEVQYKLLLATINRKIHRLISRDRGFQKKSKEHYKKWYTRDFKPSRERIENDYMGEVNSRIAFRIERQREIPFSSAIPGGPVFRGGSWVRRTTQFGN